ncbi:hypothetical protein AYR56_09965 [Loigolactobacillus backii]|uniref:Capsular polysaccharide biosynthesis protein CpsC n=1 Tax=Loigolactobacillus backii TaxID=375175 RepID=A0A192H2T6_9LACO|nr:MULTISPECIES: Wzz/FepE/Etk N-terminal domain-containing protein [Loigolactobacillus]ANK62542.1 hypothetical protein AYR53_07035 [Loigolactobacillus backii]ANK70447.1 hypothetical protein AYR56_09965 [Loigolactobacillus backii]
MKDEISIVGLFKALLRRWYVILLAIIIFAMSGIFAAKVFYQPTYKASAIFYVEKKYTTYVPVDKNDKKLAQKFSTIPKKKKPIPLPAPEKPATTISGKIHQFIESLQDKDALRPQNNQIITPEKSNPKKDKQKEKKERQKLLRQHKIHKVAKWEVDNSARMKYQDKIRSAKFLKSVQQQLQSDSSYQQSLSQLQHNVQIIINAQSPNLNLNTTGNSPKLAVKTSATIISELKRQSSNKQRIQIVTQNTTKQIIQSPMNRLKYGFLGSLIGLIIGSLIVLWQMGILVNPFKR